MALVNETTFTNYTYFSIVIILYQSGLVWVLVRALIACLPIHVLSKKGSGTKKRMLVRRYSAGQGGRLTELQD